MTKLSILFVLMLGCSDTVVITDAANVDSVVLIDASTDTPLGPSCSIFTQPNPPGITWRCLGTDNDFLCEKPEFKPLPDEPGCYAYCLNGGTGGTSAGRVTSSVFNKFTTLAGVNIVCEP